MYGFEVGDIVAYKGKFHQDEGPIVEFEDGYIYIENGPMSRLGVSHHRLDEIELVRKAG